MESKDSLNFFLIMFILTHEKRLIVEPAFMELPRVIESLTAISIFVFDSA
jgi:hypothetical protein